MASSCYMGLVGDSTMPSEVDTIIRANAVKQKAIHGMFVCIVRVLVCVLVFVRGRVCFNAGQVSSDKIHVIGWVDFTKIGVLTQKDVNKFGAWCEKLLSKNPTSSQLS